MTTDFNLTELGEIFPVQKVTNEKDVDSPVYYLTWKNETVDEEENLRELTMVIDKIFPDNWVSTEQELKEQIRKQIQKTPAKKLDVWKDYEYFFTMDFVKDSNDSARKTRRGLLNTIVYGDHKCFDDVKNLDLPWYKELWYKLTGKKTYRELRFEEHQSDIMVGTNVLVFYKGKNKYDAAAFIAVKEDEIGNRQYTFVPHPDWNNYVMRYKFVEK